MVYKALDNLGAFKTWFGVQPNTKEAMLVGLLLLDHSPAWLIAIASAGNVRVSALNWMLARQVEKFRSRRWFPVSEAKLGLAQRWCQCYGKWSLLLSWVPVVGDPLTEVAMVLGTR